MGETNQELMSVTEYARSRKARGLPGGTRVAVYKAIQSGRISRHPSGKINRQVADKEWLMNTMIKMPQLGVFR